jgi:carotenoid cleavage oxygenase
LFNLEAASEDPEMLDPSGVFPYRWDPAYPARIGVLPRDGGADDVRWFDIEPCYVFHGMNAYDDDDDDGRIVLDVVRHPKMFDSERPGPNEQSPTLDRWTIDLALGTVREDRLDDRPQEFPRVDERLTGRRHRYGYSVGGALQTGDSLLHRYDLVTGRHDTRSFGSGRTVGEFVFVPSANDSAEDDGVLMGYVAGPERGASDLVLVDSATPRHRRLGAPARACPHRIPRQLATRSTAAASGL